MRCKLLKVFVLFALLIILRQIFGPITDENSNDLNQKMFSALEANID